MLFYRAYDLSVASDSAVPGLVEVPPLDHPDLQLLFETASPIAAAWQPWFESPNRTPSGRATLVAHQSADATMVRFTFDEGPAFTIDRDARRIWIGTGSAAADGPVSALPYLLGPVLGIVLRMRGVVCLHASGVVIDGGAHIFVGAEGAGKSTLAAQFAAEGFPVLTDDVVALRSGAQGWLVAPGYPRVRLWNDAVTALPIDRAYMTPPTHGSARSQLDLARARVFSRESQPAACLYLLEYDETLREPVIDTILATNALPVLAANTFARRVLNREQQAEEFALLADLVDSVPVRRLRRPTTIGHLTATTSLVTTSAVSINRYSVYGRALMSNRPISALMPSGPTASDAIDVRFVTRPDAVSPMPLTERYVSSFRSDARTPMLRAGLTADRGHVLDYWDGTRCTIDASGTRLVLESPPGAGDPVELLLGLGLAFALRLRGHLAVHAAGIDIGGEGVLLAGLPRAGKSTLAAALHALGHHAVSDDVCVIDFVGGRTSVHAGPRRLRLRADSRAVLERAVGRALRLSAAPDGRHLDLALPRTAVTSTPIGGIYWLERLDTIEESGPQVRSLSAADALVRLISDTWGARLLDADMRRREFERACTLIEGVRTRVLRYADGPANLMAAAECLVRDHSAQRTGRVPA